MGHMINPISNRLNLNTFSDFSWTLNNNYNYNTMFKKNYYLFKFLNWIKKSSVFLEKKVSFSHYTVSFSNNKNVSISIFFYWPKQKKKRFKFKKKRFIRIKKRWKKSKPKKFKKRLFQLRRRRNWRRRHLILKTYRKLRRRVIKFIFLRIYWLIISIKWNKYLSFDENIIFSFSGITAGNVSPAVVANYITYRLKQRHSLKFTLNPILRDLNNRIKRNKIKGYRILCVGRFTRRQIAERNWYKQGPVTSNNFSQLIKYYQTKVNLKHGVCGVKIWISYGSNSLSSQKKIIKQNFPLVKSKLNSCYKLQNLFSFETSSYHYTNLRRYNKIFAVTNYKNNIFFSFHKSLIKLSLINLRKELKYIKINKIKLKNLKKLKFFALTLQYILHQNFKNTSVKLSLPLNSTYFFYE